MAQREQEVAMYGHKSDDIQFDRDVLKPKFRSIWRHDSIPLLFSQLFQDLLKAKIVLFLSMDKRIKLNIQVIYSRFNT
jgi:hypothetical protein